MQPRSVKVLSTGKYLPKRKVTVGELAQQLNLSADWIKRKSGVLTRYFIEDETVSFMGARAAQQALSIAELSHRTLTVSSAPAAYLNRVFPVRLSLFNNSWD